MSTTITIFLLLFLYQLKHFAADYPLQTPYMLGKFKNEGWIKPLAAHAGVHAFFTYLITIWFVPFHVALVLATFDFTIHFIMDRAKASSRLLGRFKALSADEYRAMTRNVSDYSNSNNGELKLAANFYKERIKSNTYFWWSLGLDQAVHHITHYIIIACVVLVG